MGITRQRLDCHINHGRIRREAIPFALEMLATIAALKEENKRARQQIKLYQRRAAEKPRPIPRVRRDNGQLWRTPERRDNAVHSY